MSAMPFSRKILELNIYLMTKYYTFPKETSHCFFSFSITTGNYYVTLFSFVSCHKNILISYLQLQQPKDHDLAKS